LAVEILNNISKLEFEQKMNGVDEFSHSWYAQLNYKRLQSKYYEKAHLQYPVYRVVNN